MNEQTASLLEEGIHDCYGYRMEYPTADEVRRFSREVSWEDRFEVLSQGFHRGCYLEQCYSLQDMNAFVSKRNPRNPTGGVRTIDGDEITEWILYKIGDMELAKALYKCYRSGDPPQIITDTVRNLLTVRLNQYREVLAAEEKI